LGFKIICNGQKLCDVPVGSDKYLDVGLRPATNYGYKVIAHNVTGVSDSDVYVARTKNPPIIVWIDKLGVHENGEEGELFREFSLLGEAGEGEIQIGLIASDGKDCLC